MNIRVSSVAAIFREGARGPEVLATPGEDVSKNEQFGRLLGGGLEYGETSEEALRREFREELGVELKDVHPIQTVENIFTLEGALGHQIMFLFTASFVNDEMYRKEEFPILDSKSRTAVWMPLNGPRKIYPAYDYQTLFSAIKSSK